MTVITISRQMGSLGNMVAEEIGRCLGYRVVWREVINAAAIRAGVPEVALATIDELNLLGIKPSEGDLAAYHRAVREIMFEIHKEGNAVIVGRAGQVVLRGVEGALHVRIFAPLDLRVERIAKRHGVSSEVARKQVKTSDQTRKRYLKRYYQVNLDDPELYDLLINTEHVDATLAAQVICSALLKHEKASQPG